MSIYKRSGLRSGQPALSHRCQPPAPGCLPPTACAGGCRGVLPQLQNHSSSGVASLRSTATWRGVGSRLGRCASAAGACMAAAGGSRSRHARCPACIGPCHSPAGPPSCWRWGGSCCGAWQTCRALPAWRPPTCWSAAHGRAGARTCSRQRVGVWCQAAPVRGCGRSPPASPLHALHPALAAEKLGCGAQHGIVACRRMEGGAMLISLWQFMVRRASKRPQAELCRRHSPALMQSCSQLFLISELARSSRPYSSFILLIAFVLEEAWSQETRWWRGPGGMRR